MTHTPSPGRVLVSPVGGGSWTELGTLAEDGISICRTDGDETFAVERSPNAEWSMRIDARNVRSPRSRIVVVLPLPAEWPEGRTYADVDPSVLVGRTCGVLLGVDADRVSLGDGYTIVEAVAVDDGRRLKVVAER